MPLLLVLPLMGCLVLLILVRGRRAAANLGLLTAVLTLADALLVAWARFRSPGVYRAAVPWINISVSFQGDQRFQSFGVNLAVRLDHYSLAALIALLAVFVASLTWHRVLGRSEQGAIRYQVGVLLFLLCAVGVAVSDDLAEQIAFWLVGGLGSFLLLSHRWGTEELGRAARVALALPFLGDVALLCAVALLYSRFGQLDLEKVVPVLRTTPGVGLKSLTTVALLVLAAVAVRASVWPLTAWQTGTVEQPPTLSALVAGVWPILAGLVLLRYLPVFGAADFQAHRAASYWMAAAALVGPLLGLVAADVRRALLLTSSGALALGLLGVLFLASTPLGFTALLAAGMARAGSLLCAGSLTTALRTADLRFMGGGAWLLPQTSLGLGGSAAALAFSAPALATGRPWSPAVVAIGAGLLLVSLGGFRVVALVTLGRLPRRRAFDPERVRELPAGAVTAVLVLALLGLVADALGFFAGWVAFLAPGAQPAGVRTGVPWVLWAGAGLALALALVAWARPPLLQLAGWLEERLWQAWEVTQTLNRRFLTEPGLKAVGALEALALPAVEGGLGRALQSAGALAWPGLPWTVALVASAAILAFGFSLFSPGVRR